MLFKQVFCSTCLLTENRSTNQDFFPMLHHEESPEKLQYNMAISYFALPPFLPFPSILKKLNPPSFNEVYILQNKIELEKKHLNKQNVTKFAGTEKCIY